jgi:hypothetical protein
VPPDLLEGQPGAGTEQQHFALVRRQGHQRRLQALGPFRIDGVDGRARRDLRSRLAGAHVAALVYPTPQ